MVVLHVSAYWLLDISVALESLGAWGSLLLVRDHTVHQANVIATRPVARVRPVVNDHARRIRHLAARHRHAIDRDHRRVPGPLDQHGNRHGEILVSILEARLDDPRLAAQLVHAHDRVFVLLRRGELAILDAAPAPAHRRLRQGRLELRLQFLLRELGHRGRSRLGFLRGRGGGGHQQRSNHQVIEMISHS